MTLLVYRNTVYNCHRQGIEGIAISDDPVQVLQRPLLLYRAASSLQNMPNKVIKALCHWFPHSSAFILYFQWGKMYAG